VDLVARPVNTRNQSSLSKHRINEMKRLKTCSMLVALLLPAQFGRQVAIAETPAVTDKAATVYATAVNTKFGISNLKEEEVVRVNLVLQPGVESIAPKLADVGLGDRHDQPLPKKFASWAEEPEAGAKELAEALARLKLQWREALLHQITGSNNDLVYKTRAAIRRLA